MGVVSAKPWRWGPSPHSSALSGVVGGASRRLPLPRAVAVVGASAVCGGECWPPFALRAWGLRRRCAASGCRRRPPRPAAPPPAPLFAPRGPALSGGLRPLWGLRARPPAAGGPPPTVRAGPLVPAPLCRAPCALRFARVGLPFGRPPLCAALGGWGAGACLALSAAFLALWCVLLLLLRCLLVCRSLSRRLSAVLRYPPEAILKPLQATQAARRVLSLLGRLAALLGLHTAF